MVGVRTDRTMREYLILHNWSDLWSSISIPAYGDALVISSDSDHNQHIDTLDNDTAVSLVSMLSTRPNEYTVTIVD